MTVEKIFVMAEKKGKKSSEQSTNDGVEKRASGKLIH